MAALRFIVGDSVIALNNFGSQELLLRGGRFVGVTNGVPSTSVSDLSRLSLELRYSRAADTSFWPVLGDILGVFFFRV